MLRLLLKTWLFFLISLVLYPVPAWSAPGVKDLPSSTVGSKGKAAESSLATVETEPHALGCVLPLSGRFSSYGMRALDTIILAAGLFDPKRKSPVRLIIEDTESQPEKAAGAVTKLARAGVVAIVGSLGGEECQAAAAEAQRLKVPLMTLTQKEGVTGGGGYVFRNFLTGLQQIRTLVRYAMEELQLKRFAILHPDTNSAREAGKYFQQEVVRRKGSFAWVQPYKSDQTDFHEVIKQIVNKTDIASRDRGFVSPSPHNFDALFIPDSHKTVKMIIPQLFYFDIQGIRLLGLSGWNAPSLLVTDSDYLEGAVFTDSFLADGIYQETVDFVELFHAAYGRDPDALEAEVFDAAALTLKIIRDNTGPTREKFRERLLNTKEHHGATGKISFSTTGEVVKEAFVIMVKEGKKVQVK